MNTRWRTACCRPLTLAARGSAVLALVLLGEAACAATSLTQFGITWTLASDRPAGQFANGDWWVVGPVTVTGITRPANKADRDGSMTNPVPSMDHGYDGRVGGYQEALNVANRLPNLSLEPGVSLVSTLSGPLGRPVLDVSAVLTVVGAPPPAGSFRPPYAGTDKPLHNVSKLRPDLLPTFAPVAETPALAEVEGLFEKPWIDHRLEWEGDYLHPLKNMCHYGGGMAKDTSIGILRLMLNDHTPAEKRTLLIRYVQLGIDNYALVANGACWGYVGGTIGVGRKMPILAAGVLLGDEPMRDVAKTHDTVSVFLEDGQTFALTQAARDATRHTINQPGSEEYWHPGWFDDVPLGTPVWGERYAGWRTSPETSVMPGKIAYQGLTYHSTLGSALAVRLMKLEPLWNHDVYLDWVDSCWQARLGGTWGSPFAENMFAAYRELPKP
ncbi:MAG: hypothetical protein K8T26_01100 [Lentisphaerae bacterium]|nr:hypothetical protein [Lentisphaerota bacterium]